MEFLHNLWSVLIVIGIMVLIHELGHYWAAIFFNVKVDAFSFGFGPRLFGFRRGETDFRVCAIPFGGYVKMAGDQALIDQKTDLEDPAGYEPRGFLAKPRWQRMIIAFAGPAMNVVLSIAVITGLFMWRFDKALDAGGPAIVGHVQPGGPAAQAGIQEGDVLVRMDDKADPAWEDIQMKELTGAKRPMNLVIRRNGQQVLATVTPAMNEKHLIGDAGWSEQHEARLAEVRAGMPAAGAGLQRGDVVLSVNGQAIRTMGRLNQMIRGSGGKAVEIIYARDGQKNKISVQPQWITMDTAAAAWMIGVVLDSRVISTKLGAGEAFRESLRWNAKNATLIFDLLRGMIELRMSPKSLQGPIAMAQASGEATRRGPVDLAFLLAGVSLNLAIFNLLPIPILDGGVILLLLVEMIMRRDLSINVKEAVFKAGFVFLMMVVVFVLYNDISKIIVGTKS